MLKGVNKQVLEITETHNSYFEKAIFFVKPEYSGLSEGKLKERAKKEIENAGKPPAKKITHKNIPLKFILCFCASFAVGIVIGTAFF